MQSVCACGGLPVAWASSPPSFVLVTVQVEPDTTTLKASPTVEEEPQKQSTAPPPPVTRTTQHVSRGGRDAAPEQKTVPAATGTRPKSKAMRVFIGGHLARGSAVRQAGGAPERSRNFTGARRDRRPAWGVGRAHLASSGVGACAAGAEVEGASSSRPDRGQATHGEVPCLSALPQSCPARRAAFFALFSWCRR